jgi:hypothetical protein
VKEVKKIVLGPLLMVIGLTVILIMFPILLSATHGVLTDDNIADFTGVSSFAALVPFLALLAVIFSGGVITWQGVKEGRSGGGKKHRK